MMITDIIFYYNNSNCKHNSSENQAEKINFFSRQVKESDI